MKNSNYYLIPVALVIAFSCQKEDIRPTVQNDNESTNILEEQKIFGVDEIGSERQKILTEKEEDFKVWLNSGPEDLNFHPEGNLIDQIPYHRDFVDKEEDFKYNPDIPTVDPVYKSVGELTDELISTSPNTLIINEGFIRGNYLYLKVFFRGPENPDFHVYGMKNVYKSYPIVRMISVYNANDGEPELFKYEWEKAIIEIDISSFKFQADNCREVILKIQRRNLSFSYIY